MKRCLWIWMLSLLLITASGSAATAQSATDPNAAAIESLIEQARQSGSTIVVIGGPDQNVRAAETNTAEMIAMETRMVLARNNMQAIIEESPQFFGRFGAAIRALDTEGSLLWPLWAIGFALLYLLAGYGLEYLFHSWSRPHFAYFCREHPENREEKIAYLLFRGIMQAMALVVQGAAAGVLVILFDQDTDAVRNLQFIVILGFIAYRLATVFLLNFLAPDKPGHRLIALNDEQAARLYRSALVLRAFLAVFLSLNVWVEALNIDTQTYQLLAIFLSLATLLAKSIFVFIRRKEVAAIILGTGPEELKIKSLVFLSRAWHMLAILYFAAAFAMTAYLVALDQPEALRLTNLPVLAVFCGIAVYGAALLIIEFIFTRNRPLPAADAPETTSPDIAVTEDDEPPMVEQKSFKGLADKAAGIIITAFIVWWVFNLWGMDLSEPGSFLNDFWEVLLIFFFCYLAYQAVKIGVDRKLEAEGINDEPEPGEEGGTTGASRLATLLPLFRNFLLIVIVVLGGMIMLSELGVDIAPLFAGAGVIGLAIGFGAQTLIRDIFSGAFFLMDDAFRKGEYINLGSVKGTVEKISIRSMQLRHHLGPLNTVPFGEIQQVTNFSRDWVMMKLPLRLTYDTDVEKVRKLIKKLGEELMEHPEVGQNFLQPLKSQGVFTMEDSAMIIRVKFMTKPGDQFVVRKLVYSRIRELFQEHGIKFAHREVTVRVAEDNSNHPPMTEARKLAIAGAVQPTLDDASGEDPSGEESR